MSWSTEVASFLYFIGSENRCKAASRYKADKELCFVLSEVAAYSWQRNECTVGNNEQSALAKESGREKPVAELTCGTVQLMGLAKQGQGVEKSECYIAESI